jgi:tRNA(Ile)-lysidine synthase
MEGPSNQILDAVGRCLESRRRVVLAVSGGVDSMTLLAAALERRASADQIVVAHFDHASGPHAARARALVREVTRQARVPIVVGRARQRHRSEAGWRHERWSFLSRVARDHGEGEVGIGATQARGAVVVTAHTRDDQIETVAMRIIRGAGTRGLAALLAGATGPVAVERPLVRVPRNVIESFARSHGLRWHDDPTNESRAFFRNRVRHDLLPAMRAVDPEIDEALWDLGERASQLRADLEVLAAQWVVAARRGHVVVDATLVESLEREGRAVVWQAILGRHGVVLDARGTRRLSNMDAHAPVGRRVPLAGGFEAIRRAQTVTVSERRGPLDAASPLTGETKFGTFRFWPVSPLPDEGSSWSSWIPADPTVHVRSWRAGDRVRELHRGTPRRVKRFLSEAGVMGPDREGWPVVVCRGEIIWVPGVCRGAMSAAVTAPARYFQCECRDG